MGGVVREGQVDLGVALKQRDEKFGVSFERKREQRAGIEVPVLAERADSWWKEGRQWRDKEAFGAGNLVNSTLQHVSISTG